MLQTSKNDIIPAPESGDFEQTLFTPSTTKLLLMSFCTLGIYNIYWFYKNWWFLKKTGKKCTPLLRAAFAPLFAYSCFYELKMLQFDNNVNLKFPILFLSILYFMLHLMIKLPDPYWLISYLSVLPIVLANKVALNINQAMFPGLIINNKFSKWNWLVLILGGTIFVLSILGGLLAENVLDPH